MTIDASTSGELRAPRSSVTAAAFSLWQAHRRAIVQGAWLVSIVATVALFALAVPLRLAEISRTTQNLTPAQSLVLADVLAVFGQDVATHVRLVIGIEIAVFVAFIATGALVVARRRNGIGLILSAGMATFAAWMTPTLGALAAVSPMWERAVYVVQAIGFLLAISTLYVFPTGRFMPRWTIPLLVGAILCAAAWVIFPRSVFNLTKVYQFSLASFVLVECWWISGIVAQFHRFAREATSVERQQTKWILFGFTVGTTIYITLLVYRIIVPMFAEPRFPNVVYDLFIVPAFLVVLLVCPATFAISILRYRLFEIDLVIRRTLVYTTLTAILAGLYIASIGFFQRLFVAITGERSEVAIVMTTLVVAAAFTPVKAKLQAFVDKHLREVPDPTSPLRSFSESVRGLADLLDTTSLCKRLLNEAVAAFSATGGAIVRGAPGEDPSEVAGEWTGEVVLSAPIEYGGMRFGEVRLGPRRDDAAYSERDVTTLLGIATQVGRTIYYLEGEGTLRAAGHGATNGDLAQSAAAGL